MSTALDKRPAWTSAHLVQQLREDCGVRPGQILIVHASFKSLGHVAGGPAAVVSALQTVLTPTGTLLMPVFSAPTADGIWRMADTPSRTGAITEAFRTSPGVVRSFNPTHAVAAWGARAEEFIAGHERTSPLGVASPFHQAAKAGATVLMIGCDLTACSLVHVAEAMVRVPYLGRVCYAGYDLTLHGIASDGRVHDFPPVDVPTDSKGFLKPQFEMEARGMIRRVPLAEASCIAFAALPCLDLCIELLNKNPGALLCANASCPVCVPAKRILSGA